MLINLNNLGNIRLSRRYYKGLYKNRSNVGEILREARNEVDKTLNPNQSMNLSINHSPRSPSSRGNSSEAFNKSQHLSEALTKVTSVDQINNDFSPRYSVPSEVSKKIKQKQKNKFVERFHNINQKIDSSCKF